MIGGMEQRPGDWQCPGCGDYQFGRNSHCRKCQTPRPGLDPALAAEPPPKVVAKGGASNLYVSELPTNIDEHTLKAVFSCYGVVVDVKVLAGKSSGPAAGLVRLQTVEEAQWIVQNLNGNIPQGLSAPIAVKFATSPEEKKGKGGSVVEKGMGKGMDKGMMMAKMMEMMKGGVYGKADGGDFGWSPNAGPYNDKGSWNQGGIGGIAELTRGLIDAGALPGCREFSNSVNALFVGSLPMDTTDLDLYKIFCGFGPIPAKGVRCQYHPDGTFKGFGFVNFVSPHDAQRAIMTLNGTQMPNGQVLIVTQAGDKSSSSSTQMMALAAQQGINVVTGGQQTQPTQLQLAQQAQQAQVIQQAQPTAEQMAEQQMQAMFMQQQQQQFQA